MKTILVTGGLGFIGSHTCLELANSYRLVIIDNLSNTEIGVLDKIRVVVGKDPLEGCRDIVFYQVDLLNKDDLNLVFTSEPIWAIIHFAALKSVGESVKNPLLYYNNNLISTLNLLEAMDRHKCYNLVFSSSATVYGSNESPLCETMEIGRGVANPYGRTKVMIEEILRDVSVANSNYKIIALRYFNPIGGHKSGLFGDNPKKPSNLMPHVVRVAKGESKKLLIYGGDYETRDGTGVRDYIHVVDLAIGHRKALEGLRNGYYCYNLGTGRGTSVLDLVKTFSRTTGVDISYEVVERREGDLAVSMCDPSLAKIGLGWEAKLGLEEMCSDSYNLGVSNEVVK